ncbi:MAG: NTP transferase domain-containing protein [Qipengyuania sp.]|nr:NTP transferase domain-containing protein [Qipengyuania sp.]
MTSRDDLGVVILAGGEARRMGGGKPLRMLAGRTLLDRAIERAMRWSDRVVIAARSREQVAGVALPVVIDPPGSPDRSPGWPRPGRPVGYSC